MRAPVAVLPGLVCARIAVVAALRFPALGAVLSARIAAADAIALRRSAAQLPRAE